MTVHRINAEHLHSVRATLGEGPLWDERRGGLWFVDIAAPAIHLLVPNTGERTSWPAPAAVGWIALMDDRHLMAGLADGLYRFTPDDGGFMLLHRLEADERDTRINDGTRDVRGNYWFGTMSVEGSKPIGRFYLYDGESVTETGISPVPITNGPAVAPDGRTLYTVDTLGRIIFASEIGDLNRLGPAREFASIDPQDGYPDGVSCDAEGGLWVGLWNGWSARRYDAAGMLTDEVRFPVANVTKITLGGANGTNAYATTAREGQEGDLSGHQELGGDIFQFPVRVGAMQLATNRIK